MEEHPVNNLAGGVTSIARASDSIPTTGADSASGAVTTDAGRDRPVLGDVHAGRLGD